MTSLSTETTRVVYPNLKSNEIIPDNNMWAGNNQDGTTHRETIPLIEAKPAPPPPLAGPEIDDLSDAENAAVPIKPYPGVDDGFFSSNPNPESDPEVERIPPVITTRAGPGEDEKPNTTQPINPTNNNPTGNGGPNYPLYPNYPYNPDKPFPYAPGFGPNDNRIDPEFGGAVPVPENIPDVNVYQHKKTLAQGFLDLALFSANANQLRYVLESFERHPYYYPSVIMISFSLICQVLIGCGLIWNARYDVKDKVEICVANKINNYTVVGIFLVTAINVFISAFGVAGIAPISTPIATIVVP